MRKRQLPIGIKDFAEIIQKNYYYVDKTSMIKEILKLGAKVPLITRPRRFGKTLNLSMIKYFFEKPVDAHGQEEKSYKHLFNGLAISKHSKCMAHQGKYPVIFFTLKDVKNADWDGAYGNIKKLITDEWSRHRYLIKSTKLFSNEQDNVSSFVLGSANKTNYENSLKTLCEYLHRHHGVKPIVLIDEYDTPIHSGYKYDYYDKVIEFMRSWLGAGLKDNDFLEFGIVTGIIKVAKESIFSGLKNLLVCDTTTKFFADKFGFLGADVKQGIKNYGIDTSIKDVEAWYNGYKCGKAKVYNPWSIVQFLAHDGQLASYWTRTGTDDIIKPLLQKASDSVKVEMEILMTGGTIDVEKNENIIFPELNSNPTTIWNFLLGCGYVTWTKRFKIKLRDYISLKIPNDELRVFFEQTVEAWLDAGGVDIGSYKTMLSDLVCGDMDSFSDLFKEYAEQSVSFFDPQGKYPERFYHGFVLGLLVGLQQTHQVKSNRESGRGRCDVMIIPKNRNKLGVVLEFKKFNLKRDKTLKNSAEIALTQIKETKYVTELHDAGVKKVVLVGVAFKGKGVEMVYDTTEKLKK